MPYTKLQGCTFPPAAAETNNLHTTCTMVHVQTNNRTIRACFSGLLHTASFITLDLVFPRYLQSPQKTCRDTHQPLRHYKLGMLCFCSFPSSKRGQGNVQKGLGYCPTHLLNNRAKR